MNKNIGYTEIHPPPLYPPLERKPAPLTSSPEMDYRLMIKQNLIDRMQLSPSYIKMPRNKSESSEQEIDKLVAELHNVREKYDWRLFPAELRPKAIAKRRIKREVKKEVDIEKTLSNLEKVEEKPDHLIKKSTNEDEEDTDEKIEMLEDEEDEEMDDGTDYVNNYFDNGEDFDDDEDNFEGSF